LFSQKKKTSVRNHTHTSKLQREKKEEEEKEKKKKKRRRSTWKLMGGGGLRGSIFTTLDSTLGGGRKLFLLTFITCVTLASSCVFTDSLQYSSSPGLATRRRANSLWNMSSADLKMGRCSSSLKTMGEEIWYGKLATHTSK